MGDQTYALYAYECSVNSKKKFTTELAKKLLSMHVNKDSVNFQDLLSKLSHFAKNIQEPEFLMDTEDALLI